MAYGLINRIFTHAQEQGWLAPESIIVDPFGGISSTGIIAAYRGYRSVTVELEPKFTGLAMQNVKLHKAKWDALKCPYPVIIQGDSRKLVNLVESASLIVSSPPYAESLKGNGTEQETYDETHKMQRRKGGSIRLGASQRTQGYGESKGNLGNLKAGDISMIVKNKKINLDSQTDRHIIGICKNVKVVEKQSDAEVFGVNHVPTSTSAKSSRAEKSPPDTPRMSQQPEKASQCQTIGGQNTKTGQAAERVGEDTLGGNKEQKHLNETDINVVDAAQNNICKSITKKVSKKRAESGITSSKTLKQSVPDAISKSIDQQNTTLHVQSVAPKQKQKVAVKQNVAQQNAKENLNHEQAENTELYCFWKAAREIVEQCHQILRPGGKAIFVCKDFVRKGQRVPFSDDWLKLCEFAGFKLTCRHKAMLVKEDVKESLFGGKIVKKTEYKGFFRRMTEKRGSPKIDWEDVLCMQKTDNLTSNR